MRLFLLTFTLLFFCRQIAAQRASTRGTARSAIVEPKPLAVSGKVIQVEITNADTLPVYLRFGPWRSIWQVDTVALVRYYSCRQNQQYPYYELDYFVSEENNCVSWYTLQKINPGDTVRLVCKLKDLADTDSSTLYIKYLKDLDRLESIAKYLNDPNTIVQLKESMEFKHTYVEIPPAKIGMHGTLIRVSLKGE
jgi:hypothetical protein